jgi:hypothetical protein
MPMYIYVCIVNVFEYLHRARLPRLVVLELVVLLVVVLVFVVAVRDDDVCRLPHKRGLRNAKCQGARSGRHLLEQQITYQPASRTAGLWGVGRKRCSRRCASAVLMATRSQKLPHLHRWLV